jgi:hypothetical protein
VLDILIPIGHSHQITVGTRFTQLRLEACFDDEVGFVGYLTQDETDLLIEALVSFRRTLH